MLSRAFCAVAVVATLSLWSVGHAADEAAEKTASEPGAAEAHQDGGGAAADGHDGGDHSGAHVGHKGVAEATRDRARGEIERARDQALKDLFDQVSTQVTAATEHVLGRSLDAADQQRLIAEALADVTAGVD